MTPNDNEIDGSGGSDDQRRVTREASMTVNEVFRVPKNFDHQISALSDHDPTTPQTPTPPARNIVNIIENMNLEEPSVTLTSNSSENEAIPASTNKKILQKQTSAMSTKTSVTYAGQTELPPLPIPSLEETLNKFLVNLEALMDDPEQRREAQMAVLDFIKGDGPRLQEILLEYDRQGRASGAIGSYVEEFWNDSYLAPEASVVMNLNPFFVLEDSPDPKISHDPIRRAASLCFASVKLASQLRFENLRPDTHRGKPLCMDQFKALFSTCRVPMKNSKDSIHVFDKSNHVVVLCRSQIYYFQALWPGGNCAVDEGDLVDIFAAIHSHAQESCAIEASRNAIGILTSLSRKEWAVAREELVAASSKNEESLEIIDSALFVLVLDDYIPKSKHDAAANMLHGSYELKQTDTEKKGIISDYQAGTCCNRWYDKLQIIVCGDGTAGINFEHSAIDGHTALRFVSDVYAETVISFAQSIVKMVQAHEMVPSVIQAKVQRAAVTLDDVGRTKLDVFPKKITFNIPESVKRKIFFAETALGDEIVASETYILEFKDYGKLFITGNKLSPDSFVQMSMMLAYYKLYGRIVCTYEPVLTKSFYHGRTEAMRSATVEAKHFCEVFCDATSTNDAKLSALRNATRVHSQLVKECARGKGVDRHLFSLKCIAEKYDMPIPPFFKSAAWKMLNHTVLSTSNCGNPSLAMFGFGPVVANGLGIGYIIKDSSIQYGISSKHRQTTRYAYTLKSVLRDMAALLIPSSPCPIVAEDRPRLSSIDLDKISYDSYGDIWGESTPTPSPKTSPKVVKDLPMIDLEGALEIPAVVAAKQPTRWEADIDSVTEKNEEREQVVNLNDQKEGSEKNEAGKDPNAHPPGKMKRRGSKDLIPTIPARRGNATGGPIVQRKSSFEYAELSKRGGSIDMVPPSSMTNNTD